MIHTGQCSMSQFFHKGISMAINLLCLYSGKLHRWDIFFHNMEISTKINYAKNILGNLQEWVFSFV